MYVFLVGIIECLLLLCSCRCMLVWYAYVVSFTGACRVIAFEALLCGDVWDVVFNVL